MKIVIAVLIVILILVGFQFYNFITDEITEASIHSIHTFEEEDIETIPVDNLEQLTSYSHRVSTYEHTFDDLITAVATYAHDLDFNYHHIYYIQNGRLIHEESNEMVIDIHKINKELLIAYPNKVTLETNLNSEDITYYDMEGLCLIYIQPHQTGQYQVVIDETTIHFENIER